MKRMKFLSLLGVLLAPFLSPAQTTNDAFAAARMLGRGVNLLGWDRVWENRAQGRFQPRYFKLIKEAGFDHVRINLLPFRQMDATNRWALQPAWFETLDWIIGLAREQKLKIVLDLHEFSVIGKDPAAQRERFLAFWDQLTTHCAKQPEDVLFEILNEPSEQLTPQLWNEFLRDALAIIRKTNPARTVVVGPAFWNSVDHLHELELPENDRHLLVTIHYYQPFHFTHQGASWAGLKEKTGVDWAGIDAERKAIMKDFSKADAWAKEHQRPLYLGEFGAYDKAPMDARARWTDTVARAAETHGWCWAYWQFERDFFVFDTQRDEWVQPVLRALIPGKAAAVRGR